MVIGAAEGKARRLEGMKRANLEMTSAEKIQRALTNGRPPASELKTPLAAVTAARTLYRELESRMTAEGLLPKLGDWAVSIGYVTADLSVLGFSFLFEPGKEAELMKMLDGNIMLGLIFGIVDRQAEDKPRTVLGARAFLTTKQTDAWLDELLTPVRLEMELP